MYLNFFGFIKDPFNITPDPDFLFLSASHKEALASIIYGVEQRKGFIILIGEVGTGKTTIIRSYLERADLERIKFVYLFNSNLSFDDFLRQVLIELEIPEGPKETIPDMIRQLHNYLINQYRENFNIIIIVDEAQNMPVQTLEQLRMLSNLETTREKLIQIILVGQPELDDKLNMYQLRQFKQRIAIRAVIQPLSQKDSMAYITHRLAKVTYEPECVFTKMARIKIVNHARGIPRVLNNLCDNALISTYGHHKKQVNLRIARKAINVYEGKN